MKDLRVQVLEENVKKMRVRSAERGMLISDLFGEVFSYYENNCGFEPERVRGRTRAVWWKVSDEIFKSLDVIAGEVGMLKYVLVNAAISYYFDIHPQK